MADPVTVFRPEMFGSLMKLLLDSELAVNQARFPCSLARLGTKTQVGVLMHMGVRRTLHVNDVSTKWNCCSLFLDTVPCFLMLFTEKIPKSSVVQTFEQAITTHAICYTNR